MEPLDPLKINPMMMTPDGSGQNQGTEGTNLLNILIDAAFGFVSGLMLFIGPKEVISYGTKLAGELLALTGSGQQLGGFGFAATAAPYVVIGPILGMVARQLSSVRSLKSFAYFAIAAIVGLAAAYFSQGYFTTLVSKAV